MAGLGYLSREEVEQRVRNVIDALLCGRDNARLDNVFLLRWFEEEFEMDKLGAKDLEIGLHFMLTFPSRAVLARVQVKGILGGYRMDIVHPKSTEETQ